jgi:hypothetical protein
MDETGHHLAVTSGPDAGGPGAGGRGQRGRSGASRGRGRWSAVSRRAGLGAVAVTGAGVLAAAVAAAPAAALPLPPVQSGPVTIHEDCQFTEGGVPQDFGQQLPLTMQVTTHAPAAVGTEQELTVTPTVAFTIPWWLEAAVALNPATIEQVSLTVAGTDVHPASEVATAAPALPVSGGFFTGPADTVTLSPLTFTAGAPGTATFSAGGTTVALQMSLLFGLGTVPATISCTVDPGQRALATVSVAQVSTTPVGSTGGVLLAGTLGVGAAGTAVWRRRTRRRLGGSLGA